MKKQSKLINDDLSRIPKPKPWDRVLKRGHYALLLLFVMVFITNVQNVQAEGSKDLYPLGVLGSRAYLRVSTSENTAFPFPTLGTHYVYAKVGETIAIATDAQKTTNKRIFLFSPTNVDVTPTGDSSPNATRGNIPNRDAELAGPKLPGVTSGTSYTPIYYTVPAGGEGIYRVEFIGGGDSTTEDIRYDASTTGQAANSWPILKDNNYLVAWDISVANTTNSAWISGRVFTNVLNMDDPSYKSGTTSEFATNSGFYGKVKVLTRDGFVYNVNNNGMQGISFTFMSNNIGFHVAGDPSTQSYQSISASTAQVVKDRYSDPRQPCKDGIYTQKIFYNLPNDDMPAKAKSSDLGGEECWLKTVRPNLDLGSDDVTFVGADGSSNPWEAGSKGGYFVFKAVPGIKYNINIVPDNTSLTPRILKGTVTEELVDGEYARIYWDGKDGGSPAQLFPVGENPGTVTVGLEGAEVHFPYIDVELNKNGIIIQLLKANGDVESDIVYWDDTSIGVGGGSSGSKSYPINNSHLPSGTGSSSATNGHIWGTGSNATAGTFGDTMGIDTWTFAKGETYEDYFKVTFNKADLAITELTPDKIGKYEIDDEITYTIKVANLGNGTDFKVNAENAPFHFVVPEGFEPIGETYYTFDGNECGNESSGEKLVFDATTNTFKSELDLPDGCVVTYTITLKITKDANLGTGEVKAGILRPVDVYDPDGTNISDPLNPLGDINGPTYDFDNYFYPPFDPFIEAANNGKSGVSNNIANKPVTVVEAEDLPPVAIDDYLTTPVDTPVSGNILTNDSGEVIKVTEVKDAKGNTITIGGTTPQEVKDEDGEIVGTIIIDEDGSFTFTPEDGFTGEIPLDYTITDENDLTDDAKLVIKVIPTVDPTNNNPPIATDDNVTGPKDTPITGNVKENDYDPDGDDITVTKITVPNESGVPTDYEPGDEITIYDGGTPVGKITVEENGDFSFTPEDPVFTGKVPPINYTVCDDKGGCDDANLNITIIDKSPSESAVYAEDDYNFQNEDDVTPMTGEILKNDVNTGTGDLTVSAFSYEDEDGNIVPGSFNTATPIYKDGEKVGELTLNPDGTYSFDPEPDFVGTISIPYTAKNDDGETDDATLYLTRLPVLTPPVAIDDYLTTPVDTPVSGNILTNDSGDDIKVKKVKDAQGNTITIGSATPQDVKDAVGNKVGTITIKEDGSFTFTPEPNFTGEIPLDYTIEDENDLEDDAKLVINVIPAVDPVNNNPPIATDDNVTGPKDTPITGKVTDNDYDPDEGDEITVTKITVPNESGVPTDYEPGDEITIYDGGTPVGTITIDKEGNFTFTPEDPNFTGNVPPINYTVCDDGTPQECDNANLNITIIDKSSTESAVYAEDDYKFQNEDETDPMEGNILTNDTNTGTDPLTVSEFTYIDSSGTPTTVTTVVGTPVEVYHNGKKAGDLTLNPDGTYSFDPEPDFVGTISIPYTAKNADNETDDATLYLTRLPVLEAPVAKDDINQTPMNTEVSGDVLTNDTGEGDLTVVEVTIPGHNDGNPVTVPAEGLTGIEIKEGTNTIGTISIKQDGTYTFTPETDFVGTVPTIAYKVEDENGLSDDATLTIEVLPVVDNVNNNPPTARDDKLTGKPTEPIESNITGNDNDPDGDPIKVKTVGGKNVPEDGCVTIEVKVEGEEVGTLEVCSDGKTTYTPTNNTFTGEIPPISYTVCDDAGACDDANIIITIVEEDGVNSTEANDDTNSAPKGETMTGNVLDNDNDPEGDVQTLTSVTIGGTDYPITVGTPQVITITGKGTLTIDDKGKYTFVPEPNFVGTVVVEQTVCDNGTPVACDNATLYLTTTDVKPNYWVGTEDNEWNDPDNWTVGVPLPGKTVEFATKDNNNNVPAVNDLHVPTGDPKVVKDLINESNKALVVPPTASITVTGEVVGSEDPANANKIVIEAEKDKPNGSFIALDACDNYDVYATVELWAQGKKVDNFDNVVGWTDATPNSPTGGEKLKSSHTWQHFGVPAEGVMALDAFEYSWIQKYSEEKNGKFEGAPDGLDKTFYDKWDYVKPYETLNMFEGYEITQDAPTLYTIKGKLNFCDKTLNLTRIAEKVVDSAAENVVNNRYGLGQNIFGNSYTAAINLANGIEFDGDEKTGLVERTVYLYRTGSFQDWGGGSLVTTDTEPNAGSYIAIPANVSNVIWDNQIPSLQGFLLKFKPDATVYSTTGATVKLKYTDGGVVANKRPQLAERAPLSHLSVTMSSKTTVDRVWLFSQEGTSDKFDNGWDGFKSFGTPTAFIYSPTADGAMQVNTSDNIDGKVLTILPNKDTNYTLTLNKSNLDEYSDLHLVDLVTRKVTPLSGETTTYNFTANHAGQRSNRFIIVNSSNIDLDKIMSLDAYLQNNNTLVVSNLTSKAGRAYLYDVSGKALMNEVIQPSMNQFPVSLQSGVYILTMEAAGIVESVKLIVK